MKDILKSHYSKWSGLKRWKIRGYRKTSIMMQFRLATEARQKLKKIHPLSLAQASRISGVNPADISILLVYLEHGKIAKVSNE